VVLPALAAAVLIGAGGVPSRPDPHFVVMGIAALVLLLFSATLSAAEAALFSLGLDQVEALERQGRRGSLSARALLTFRDETLLTILLADYVANLTLVVAVLAAFSHILADKPVVWVTTGVLVSTVLVVVPGEFLPRALGRCYNVGVALTLARPLVGLTVLVAPLRWVVLGVANALLGLPNDSLLERELGSEEELKTLITGSNINGGIEEDERELIDSVVEFGLARARDIMTPRPELCAFCDDTAHAEMLDKMRLLVFSRVLVYTDTLDEIRGVLHVKDLLLKPDTDYRTMLRKPLVVPETKGLNDLMREFRLRRVHIAVVCDEFGRTAGVVTMHDLLEEIVGEMTDESRRGPEPVRQIEPGTWLVPGRVDIYDLREQLGLVLPEDLGRTISGVVTNRLARLPAVGDAIEHGGFRLTVERMGVRRVALLRVERLEPAEDAPQTDENGKES
jgi:putative hemolysin